MKKKLIVLSGFVLGLAPVVALAAETGRFTACRSNVTYTTLESILCKIGDLLSTVVPILIALGVVYFVWGVITYVIASDEEAKSAGRNRVIYGIIVAVWGLVKILTNTFGIPTTGQDITLPTTPY